MTERVEQAAVSVRGLLFTGTSHRVAVRVAAEALEMSPADVWGEAKCGFRTSQGRFVSRAVAWKLAKRGGQLRWDTSRPGVTPELHSEDLR